MGYRKFVYQRASEILSSLKTFDIVEINRISYCHFVLYLGKGMCVHVTTKNKKDKKFARSSSATKVVEHIFNIAGSHLVRVKKFKLTRAIAGIRQRSSKEIWALALDGLPRINPALPMSLSNVVKGRGLPVPYDLLSFENCEGYVTYWKYNSSRGWSDQALTPMFTPLQTAGRAGQVVMAGYRHILHNGPPIFGPIALMGAAVGGTVGALNTIGDTGAAVISGFLQRIFK